MEREEYTKERFLALQEEFKQKENAFHEQIWIDTNVSEFDETLRINHSKSVQEFCEIVITTISELTNSFSGLFYVYSEDEKLLHAQAGYACLVEDLERQSYQLNEGIIGQTASSKNTIVFDNIPPDNIEVKVSSAHINAATIIVIPLIFSENVYGVIELVYIRPLPQKYRTLLDKICRNTAAVLESLQNQVLMQKLLEESQEQTARLTAQEEEMRQNLEELSATQETMEQQRRELEHKEIQFKKLIEEMKINEEDMIRREENMQEVVQEFQRLKQELAKKDEYIKTLEEGLSYLKE